MRADAAPDVTAETAVDAGPDVVMTDGPDDADATPDAADVVFTPPRTRALISEACMGRTPSTAPVDFAFTMGDSMGRVSMTAPADLEAVNVIPTEPTRINRLRIFFRGGDGGEIRVHVVRDLGRSVPDADGDMPDLFPPATVRWAQNGWVDIPVVPAIDVHPAHHVWIMIEHVTEPMGVALGTRRGTESRSMCRVQSIIDRLRAMGEQFFEWVPPSQTLDYMIEAHGTSICGPAPAPFFTDVTTMAALTRAAGTSRASWVDVDGDGWSDAIGIQNATMTDPHTGPVVFRNNHDGTFSDYTMTAGLDAPFGQLTTFADFDGDGDVDLYVGDYQDGTGPFPMTRGSSVWLQGADRRFTRVMTTIEPAGPTAASSAGDCDGDGNLDLFIGQWLRNYPMNAAPDFLYRGLGDGSFEDYSSHGATLGRVDMRPTYGVMFTDYDNDGDADIFVANYGGRDNDLWRNDGRCNLVNVATTNRISSDGRGQAGTSFGFEPGDYDNDGDIDVFETNIGHPRYDGVGTDHSRLLRNNGAPMWNFTEVTADAGIQHVEGDIHGSFGDYDNDGDLDLFVSSTYPTQASRLYRQEADHTFTDVTYLAGVGREFMGDGAWADYDRDGDLDFLTAPRSAQVLFRNDLRNGNHWIQIRLRATGRNVDAVGARITVESAGGLRQIREVLVGRGHHGAQNPLLQHFGLGASNMPVRVRVRWPDGMMTDAMNVMPDRVYSLRQGEAPMPM